MSSAKQKAAARRNLKKARAAKRKKSERTKVYKVKYMLDGERLKHGYELTKRKKRKK